MNFKRIACILLSSLLLPAVLSACGSPGNNTKNEGQENHVNDQAGKVIIHYYGGWTGADLEKMQGLVNDFNKTQNKIHVDFTSQQWSNMFTKFLADYQAGSAPDVIAMHTFEIGQFAEMGVLDPNMVAQLNLKANDYSKIAWNGCQYDGKLYGVPLDINMHALYYNKDLFKKAGITEIPTTKESFLKSALKLTIDNNGKTADEEGFDPQNIKQFGFGFAMNHHAFYQLYALMNQEGYNPFTTNMKTISLDPAKLAVPIQWMEDLIFKYHVVPVGEKSPIDDFKAGRVAMAVDGNWQLSGFSKVKFEWNTMPYPQIFSNKAVWGAAELLTFPKMKNPDQAKEEAARTFVKWLSENSVKWAESGQIPANLEAQKAAPKLQGIDAYLGELDYVKFIPAHPKAVKIFSSAAPSPILTAAQDMVLNHKGTSEITKQLEKDVNAVLAQ